MSFENPKSPVPNGVGQPDVIADEDADRKHTTSGATDLAVEIVSNGAEMVADGVGTVVSSVVSALGDIG